MKAQRPSVKIALVTAQQAEVLERAAKEANVHELIPKTEISLARIQRLLASDP